MKKLFLLLTAVLLWPCIHTHAYNFNWQWSEINGNGTKKVFNAVNGYPLYRWQFNSNLLLFMTVASSGTLPTYTINGVSYVMPSKGEYDIQNSCGDKTITRYTTSINGYYYRSMMVLSNTNFYCESGKITVAEGADGPFIHTKDGTVTWFTIYTNSDSGHSCTWSIGSPATYYDVTVESNDDDMGSVEYTNKSGYVYPISNNHWKKNSVYTLKATKKDGCRFVEWQKNDATIATTTSIDVEITGDATYTAIFESEGGNQYTINTAVNNPALGSITAGGKKSENTNFTITATANDPNEYYVEDWLKNDTSMGVMKNSLVVPVTAAEDNNTYTAVFAQRTKKALFCDDDMTFSGNGPYTFSGTATDAQNNVYNISLSTTNVSQGNFSVQEKTNAINSITSKSGTVTTSQLSNTYYAVNAVVIGSDEIRYDISGGFPLAPSGSYQNFTISELITAEEVTVPGAPTIVESPFNPSNQKLIHLIAHRTYPQTKNYVELWIKAPAQQYNSKIGPVEGTYQSYAPSFNCSTGWSFNHTTGLIGYNDDGCWNDDGDHYVCYLSSYCCNQLDLSQTGESYFGTSTTVSVEKGKNGDMFVIIYVSGSPYIVIGEPAAPPTLVLGETTNGTFSATDGTKNYTAGRYKMPIGAQLSLTATPAESYVVEKWLLNGAEVGDELGNLMKATELTYTVASEDVVDDKITIVPVFGEKSDCTMAFDDIAVELNEHEHSARLVAANSVGGVAVLDFIGLTSFDEQIGVSAGTYTIGTDLVVGNAVAQTGSYVTDGSSTWNLASGTITIAKANGKMTLTTSSVKSTDPQDVTLTATDITCSVIRRITYVINDALYSDNNDGRFRFIGTIGNKEINICFYGNELNPVGPYTNDEIYDGDSPNNYVTIADVKCYNVQYATVTKDGNHYILDAEFDNPNGGYYHVIMKALVPKSGDTMEDYLVTRNDPSSYVTFAESDITVTQQAEGYQYLHAKTGGDNYMEAKMYFYTGSAEGGIPTGTYTISDSQQPGTVRMINSTAYRSYTQTNWYIARGTVTVVHQNNHYYIVVRAFNTRYKATDNRQYTVNFTIGTEIKAQTYKVTFKGGGGSGTMTDQEINVGEPTNLNANTFTAPTATITYDYQGATGGNSKETDVVTAEFDSWYDEDSETSYDDEQEVTDLAAADETVTLTAQWMYNTITLPTPTKTGYTFAGWEDEDGGSHDGDEMFFPEKSQTFTATWTKATTLDLYDNRNAAYYNNIKALNGKTYDVTYHRSTAYTSDNGNARWYTLCLPFNVDQSQLDLNGLTGKVYEYRYAEGSADENDHVTFHFRAVKSPNYMHAGQGYLVKATGNMGPDFTFENVTLNTSADVENGNVDNLKNSNAYKESGDIAIVGVLRNGTLSNDGRKVMGLANNKIWYPHSSGNPMPAYRAYFYNPNASASSVMPRVRIVVEGEDTTELEVVDGELYDAGGYNADGDGRGPSGVAKKYIRNGVLIIERNGVRYDAQGKRL